VYASGTILLGPDSTLYPQGFSISAGAAFAENSPICRTGPQGLPVCETPRALDLALHDTGSSLQLLTDMDAAISIASLEGLSRIYVEQAASIDVENGVEDAVACPGAPTTNFAHDLGLDVVNADCLPPGKTCAGTLATIVGTRGRDVIDGTKRDDVIVARGGADEINAGAGEDLVCGGSGPDEIRGGAHDDVLLGNGGDDHVRGGAGDDVIIGHAGDDDCDGERGADSQAAC